MNWPKEKWQQDKYYYGLTKRKMTTGQILPWPDQKKKWQQDKYYHELTKRKMTTGQILPWPDQKKNDNRTNTTMNWPKEKWQQDKYYHHLTKRKITKGQILPWPDQKKNDKRTNNDLQNILKIETHEPHKNEMNSNVTEGKQFYLGVCTALLFFFYQNRPFTLIYIQTLSTMRCLA
jgi:hypothetical protein